MLRIIVYKHQKGFAFGFFSLGLFWTLLRVIYFASLTQRGLIADLVLYWYPIDFQFATYSLVVVFHAYMLYKHEWTRRRLSIVRACCITNGGVFVQTTVYILLSSRHGIVAGGYLERAQHLFMASENLLLVGTYMYFGIHLLRSQAHRVGPSPSPNLLAMSLIVILIFISRCVYNFLSMFGSVSVGIVSEQGEVQTSRLAFLLLFLWEIVPMLMILMYFREIPATSYGWRHWIRCLRGRRPLGDADDADEATIAASEAAPSAASQPPSPGLGLFGERHLNVSLLRPPSVHKIPLKRVVSSPSSDGAARNSNDVWIDSQRYDTDDDDD